MWDKYRSRSKKVSQVDDIFIEPTPRKSQAPSVGRSSQTNSIRSKPDPFFSGKHFVPDSCEQPNLLVSRQKSRA